MNTNGVRAAIYMRVSRDDQTTENQRLVLARVAGHRGWLIVQTYEDQGIGGAKGRVQRPAFDAMLKDAVRRRYDILMVWSIDRLGRSVLHVANALAELVVRHWQKCSGMRASRAAPSKWYFSEQTAVRRRCAKIHRLSSSIPAISRAACRSPMR
jgi:hypothetical protein